MIIIKIYLASVIFYFLLLVITGVMFRRKFIDNTIRIIKSQGHEIIPREPWYITTLRYLFTSFIPVIRLICFISKMIITFNPQLVIEYNLEENNENDKMGNKKNIKK